MRESQIQREAPKPPKHASQTVRQRADKTCIYTLTRCRKLTTGCDPALLFATPHSRISPEGGHWGILIICTWLEIQHFLSQTAVAEICTPDGRQSQRGEALSKRVRAPTFRRSSASSLVGSMHQSSQEASPSTPCKDYWLQTPHPAPPGPRHQTTKKREPFRPFRPFRPPNMLLARAIPLAAEPKLVATPTPDPPVGS